MKRVAQLVLDAIAVVSLSLGLLVGAVWGSRLLPQYFWVRVSYHRMTAPNAAWQIQGGMNVLFFERVHLVDRPVVGPPASNPAAVAAFIDLYPWGSHTTSLRFKALTRPVFGTGSDGRLRMRGTASSVGVPFGWLLVLLLLPPIWRFLPAVIGWIRSKLIVPPGCCKVCGYDLRASPDRCPECGAAVAGAVQGQI